MTTDDTENGWDSLADEFGLAAEKSAEKAAKPAAAPSRPAASRPARDPRPEVEAEADDFGSGLAEEVPWKQAALYDPGPEAVEDDSEELGEAPEALDEADDSDDGPASAEGEGQDGGKKRRRRRRRRKKGAAGTAAPEAGDVEGDEDADAEGEPAALNGVEQGEAPAEVEGDDEEAPPSAVDEEMEAEAAHPRPDWHVMTWHELVAKLHRPG